MRREHKIHLKTIGQHEIDHGKRLMGTASRGCVASTGREKYCRLQHLQKEQLRKECAYPWRIGLRIFRHYLQFGIY